MTSLYRFNKSKKRDLINVQINNIFVLSLAIKKKINGKKTHKHLFCHIYKHKIDMISQKRIKGKHKKNKIEKLHRNF